MPVYQGKLSLSEGTQGVAIVVARFNELITKSLHAGAVDTLQRAGLNSEQITTVWVPGCCEIPLIAKTLAESGKYSAVICLGTVIRGATAHFDYVCQQVSAGVGRINLETGVPTIFGVLTTDTIEQATERAGTKAGNKGADAAQAAIEMISLVQELGAQKSSGALLS